MKISRFGFVYAFPFLSSKSIRCVLGLKTVAFVIARNLEAFSAYSKSSLSHFAVNTES